MVTSDNLDVETEDTSRLDEQSTIQETKDSLDGLWGGRTDVFRVETEKLKWQIEPEIGEIHVSPQLPSDVMLAISGFEKRWDLYPELQDKNVVDIGGWFGGLPFELSSSVKGLSVVDPLFSVDNLEEFLDADIEKIEKLILKYNSILEELNPKLTNAYEELDIYLDYQVSNPSSRQTVEKISSNIQWLSKRKKLLSRNIESTKKVLKQLKWWKNKFPSNVVLNWSSGEDIRWIKKWKQDIVFMNNVLSKSNIDSVKAFQEALDLISMDGQIVIVDENIDSNLSDLLEKNGIKGEENGRYIIYRINKKNIKIS